MSRFVTLSLLVLGTLLATLVVTAAIPPAAAAGPVDPSPAAGASPSATAPAPTAGKGYFAGTISLTPPALDPQPLRGAGAAPNDDFANGLILPATPNTGSSTITQSNVGATRETSEPVNCGMGSNTLWYTFTPTATNTAVASTFGTGYDTVVAVYTGSAVGGLTLVGCNDDVTVGSTTYIDSSFAWTATAGVTYRIEVGGFSTATGSAPLQLVQFGAANDALASAVKYTKGVSPFFISWTAGTAGYTKEAGEPTPCGSIGATAWFSVQPSNAMTLTASTYLSGTTYDTVIAVYTGADVSHLTNVACNDDYNCGFLCSTTSSQVAWSATANTKYWIAVGGFNGATGTYAFGITCSTACAFSSGTTTPSFSGTSGNNGWWRSSVTTTLTCSPPTSNTCLSSQKGTDNLGMSAYGGAYAISGDGVHTVDRSSYASGGGMDLSTGTVSIDATPPVVPTPSAQSCSSPGNAGWCKVASRTVTTGTATDATSGVATSSCTLDGGAVACGTITVGQGSHTVAMSATDNAGNTASSSVSVLNDNVAPVATATGACAVTGSNGWCKDASDIITTGATDASPGSGLSTQACTLDGGAVSCGSVSVGQGTHIVCDTPTDTAGNVGTQVCKTLKLDNVAPSLSGSRSPTANAQGWNNVDVTASWTCTDATSGVASAPSPVTKSAEGASQSATGTCTDNAGNSASNTVAGISIDKTAPSLGGSRAPAANGNGWNKVDVTASWTCTDALSGVLSAPASQTVTSEGAGQSRTGTCTDNAGNSASNTVSGISIDKTAPILASHADETFEATSASGAVGSFASPGASDALSGLDGSVACAPASGSSFPIGSTTISCGVSDRAGNAATASTFAVHVVDTTPPTIDPVTDLTVEAVDANGATTSFAAPATHDAVDGDGVATCSPASGSLFALGDSVVACSATDAHGNAAPDATFVVHVVDTTAPTMTAPSDITAEATSAAGAIVTFSVDATDAVDGTIAASCDPLSGTTFALGDTTVTCAATDAHGNAATPVSFQVHVLDTTAPTIDASSDITSEAAGPNGATVTFDAPATHDIVDGDGVATCDPASGALFALGDSVVACSATDAAGNTAEPTSFAVHVVDTTAPTIDAHADVLAEATGSDGATVRFDAPATHDIVDGDGLATCAPASGSLFSLGDTTITCDATDAHGNAATSVTFRVRVADSTAPVIDAVADVTAEAVGPNGAPVTYDAPATHDAVDGDRVATCAPASGAVFALGETIVTCTAADAAGNDALPVTFTVRVVDTTAPVIDAVADIAAEATSASGATVVYDAPATHDIVDGDGVATCAPASGGTFALGPTTVTCSATDADGNPAVDVTFTITIVDTTAPIVTTSLDASTLEATSSAGSVVAYSASATDIVDGALDATCDPAQGTTFPLGTSTVTCSATDAAGNTGHATFSFVVVDTTRPTIDAHADVAHEATGDDGAAVTFDAPATHDLVDGDGLATCTPASGSTFGLGATTVTCRATDANGNAADDTTFTVRVGDTTAPVIDAHDGVIAEATSGLGASVTYTSPATSDIVDGAGVASCTPASGSLFALGESTVGCTASDAHGNRAAPTSFTVTVVDTTAPTVDAADDIILEAAGPSGAVATFGAPASHDAVDGTGVSTCAPASGSTFALGDTLVSCDATDAHGNAATPSTFTVHVVDTTPPVLSATASGTEGENGWFTSAASATLGCTDRASGVATLAYALDGASEQSYLAPVLVATDGAHTLDARCVDAWGNEATTTLGVDVDTAGPSGSVSAPLLADTAFDVDWTASDAMPGSGLASIDVQQRALFGVTGESWSTVCSQPIADGPASANGSCHIDPAPGQYCYRIVARDVAGHAFTGLASDLGDPSALPSNVQDATSICTVKGTPGEAIVAIVGAVVDHATGGHAPPASVLGKRDAI